MDGLVAGSRYQSGNQDVTVTSWTLLPPIMIEIIMIQYARFGRSPTLLAPLYAQVNVDNSSHHVIFVQDLSQIMLIFGTSRALRFRFWESTI